MNKPFVHLFPSDALKIVFVRMDDEEVEFIKELIDVKHGELRVDGFQDGELEMILEFLCTSYWHDVQLILSEALLGVLAKQV